MAFSTIDSFSFALLCYSLILFIILSYFIGMHACTVPIHYWNHNILWADKKRLLPTEKKKWYSVFYFNIHFLHSYNTYCTVHESTASQPLVVSFWLYRVCIFKEMWGPLAEGNNPIKLGWWQQLLRLDCNNTSSWKQRVFINEKQKNAAVVCYTCRGDRLLLGNATTSTFKRNFHH